jgi:cyclopropane fatty-acyl-phospholipid synthase-like methyltransferase
MAGRGTGGTVGADTVREWALGLPSGGSVLDLGCGNGVPISQALIDSGLVVHGVDASASMIAAFRARFPGMPAECSPVDDSRFFDRSFDGVVAWGLMFLLARASQALLIHKVASVLARGGRFLFTSPAPACEWLDAMTGRKSVSLGTAWYAAMLQAVGLAQMGQRRDEGDNHYFLTEKI